jgi:hypothetical protein
MIMHDNYDYYYDDDDDKNDGNNFNVCLFFLVFLGFEERVSR